MSDNKTISQPQQPQQSSQPQQDTHFIGEFKEAPKFSQKNHFISKGYRINFNTPKKIFRSLFMMHNETMNIWIHLFGAIVVIFVIGFLFWTNTSQASKDNFKIEIEDKFNSFIDKVDIIGLTDKTNHKLAEITQSLKMKYQEYKNLTNEGVQAANESITNLIADIEKLFDESLIKFIEAKQNFENKGAEEVMSAIDHFGDNQTYFHQLKIHIKTLSQKFVAQIDSSSYDFVDFTETPNPGNISRWPIIAMMISALICLLCSAIYHLFYPMSGKYYTVFSRFDYAGINVLISGSTIPFLYYGMYCHPALAQFYIVCICTLALTLFVTSLFQFMHTPKYRTLKSVCYGSFGILVSVPIFHMAINEIYFPGGDKFTSVNCIPLVLALGASYLGGLVVYTKKCPERHTPGKYDICGQSHQIWHLAVMMGIFFTYLASLQGFDMRKKYPVCPIS